MNRVALIGYIGKNFKAQTTTSGKRFVQFDLQVRRKFKSPDGKYAYDFPHVQSWNPKINGYIENYLDVGRYVLVEGTVRTDIYTQKNGQKTKVTYINLENIESLVRKDSPDDQNTPATTSDFASMGQTTEGEGEYADVENLDW